MALGDLHGQRSSGTCREGMKRSCRIALSTDPARCCRVTLRPVLQKPILARKEQPLRSASTLPNGSVAGPGAINGCGNVSMRIIAQTITLVTEIACLRAGKIHVVARQPLADVLALERASMLARALADPGARSLKLLRAAITNAAVCSLKDATSGKSPRARHLRLGSSLPTSSTVH